MKKNDPSEEIKKSVSFLPHKPGVYQYFDKQNKILYIGKAKNLKKRVSSYFTESKQSGKITVMVNKIHRIEYIVVETEFDALLLENNLIKKYQPRYNVMLKDDKTFPWICIKNERFPRVFPTRNILKDGSDYFGPYASVRMMNTLLDLIRKLYPLRTCKLNLSEENIAQKKYKVCLEYHIDNCKAPCVKKQTEDDYMQSIASIKHILKGNISVAKVKLKELMQVYAEDLAFEKAQLVKEKLGLLKKYQSKSMIVSASIDNADVFSIIEEEKFAYVNYLKIIQGAVVQSHTIELKKVLEESEKELLEFAIIELRKRFESDSKEIILPFKPNIQDPKIKYIVPKIGEKKQLLEMSERNANYYRLEKKKHQSLVNPKRHSERILETLQKDLHMKILPRHIECFDNSNIQGAFPVAAMVLFRDGKPSKKEYRHYNIKTVEGPNDFASMEEALYRRYKRLLEEKKELPQLIIVDGGKGQLSSAMKSLEKLNLRGKISIIGIAKRLEEIYFPGDNLPLYLNKKSESLKVIQQLRDEAHRFGITHHRNRRIKESLVTELTDISGIGKTLSEKLLLAFSSVENVKKASEKELIAVVGEAKANKIISFFKRSNKNQIL
jgi:excinuclease ABC subunit C